MKNSTLMRYFILLIWVLIVTKSFGQITSEIDFPTFPLKKVICSCQSNPNQDYSTEDLSYYEDGKLKQVFKTYTKEESDTNIVEYYYSTIGLLDSLKTKTFVGAKGYDDVFQRTRIFKYNAKGLLIHSGFADEKGNNLTNDYQYSTEDQLLRKIVRCGSNMQIYSYEYDKSGKVLKEFKNDRLLNRFKYNKENTLEKKVSYSNARYNLRRFYDRITHLRFKNEFRAKYITKYEYDEQNRLVKVINQENVIEIRKYENGTLIEKRTNYYGTDPCFAPCCSQYIYRYEYDEIK
jgi:hypothetical protein